MIFGFLKKKLLPILALINAIALIAILIVGTIIINRLNKLESKLNIASYLQVSTDNAIYTSSDAESLALDFKSKSLAAINDSSDVESPERANAIMTTTTTTTSKTNTTTFETITTTTTTKAKATTSQATATTTKAKATTFKAVTTVPKVKVSNAKLTTPTKVKNVQTTYTGTKKDLLSALESEFCRGETLVVKNVPVFDEYSAKGCKIQNPVPKWEYVLAVKCISGEFVKVTDTDGSSMGTLVYANTEFTYDIEIVRPYICQVIEIDGEYFRSEAIISKLLEGLESPAHYESVNVWTAPI
ncbi:MAG: hypothetical protein J6J36_01355 [Clostridia bacterium]|nr:hypothetical protein [Clostridia bacterium]